MAYSQGVTEAEEGARPKQWWQGQSSSKVCVPGVRDARLLLKLKQIPRGTARGREKVVIIFRQELRAQGLNFGAPKSPPSFESPAEGAPARKKRARAHNSQAGEPARHLPLQGFYPSSGHSDSSIAPLPR